MAVHELARCLHHFLLKQCVLRRRRLGHWQSRAVLYEEQARGLQFGGQCLGRQARYDYFSDNDQHYTCTYNNHFDNYDSLHHVFSYHRHDNDYNITSCIYTYIVLSSR